MIFTGSLLETAHILSNASCAFVEDDGPTDSKFMRHSCAGRPETANEAVRRHRLANQKAKQINDSVMIPLHWEKEL